MNYTPEDFCQYKPGTPLKEAFETHKIPLLKMQDLRELNFMISRGISYERTIDSFLMLFMVNEEFRPLRHHENIVVLLNEEGALVRENNEWILYFAPKRFEKNTLKEDANLYLVYKDILQKEANGDISKISVPNRPLKTMLSGRFPFCILDEFCQKRPGGYLAIASQIVTDGPEYLFSKVPVCSYGALATVDISEIEKYHAIRHLMHEYIRRYDQSSSEKNVPLSIAVFGAPGSGKSFGVKQIAQSLGRFQVSSINISQYSSPADMFSALKEALKVDEGMIPLVFFDEFDSEYNGTPRGWLKFFLAPMQDGEFTINGKSFNIPASVFVFAGATASSFHEFLPHEKDEELTFAMVKGPDFVSRLKGILDIKGTNPSCPTDRKYMVRRALLLRNMLIKQAPEIYNKETGHIEISRGLLSALLRVSEYRHGARSIEFILGMSRLTGITRYSPSCLPMPEQLDIHLDMKDFIDKLTFEQVLGRMVDKYAVLAHEKYRKNRILKLYGPNPTPEQLKTLSSEPEMAEWDNLSEFYKKGHRNRLRYLGQKLLAYELQIGIRPVLPGATDTITELYGPVLEELARLDHERWINDKLGEGWTLGNNDSDLKYSKDMVEYDKLPESTKEIIRSDIRTLPSVLRDMGYELYRKSDF